MHLGKKIKFTSNEGLKASSMLTPSAAASESDCNPTPKELTGMHYDGRLVTGCIISL